MGNKGNFFGKPGGLETSRFFGDPGAFVEPTSSEGPKFCSLGVILVCMQNLGNKAVTVPVCLVRQQ